MKPLRTRCVHDTRIFTALLIFEGLCSFAPIKIGAQSSAAAPGFKAIFEFGHSWTDTGGNGCTWSSPEYYGNRGCNGAMWPEFVSTNLGLSYVAKNNFAQCGASSGGVLAQVQQLQALTNSAPDLVILGGFSDFLYAASSDTYQTRSNPYINWTNEVGWESLIQAALKNYSNSVEQLYRKGGRNILVHNLFDLTRTPALVSEFGKNEARFLKTRAYVTRFNSLLSNVVTSINGAKADIRVICVDIQTNLDNLVGNPGAYGFAKAFPAALDDGSLRDKSFTGLGKDYVFWDGLHPTSKAHSLIASWCLSALRNSNLERLEARIDGASPSTHHVQMNHLQAGRVYFLEKSVDLTNWSDVTSFTANAGTNHWLNSDAGVSFYRLKWMR